MGRSETTYADTTRCRKSIEYDMILASLPQIILIGQRQLFTPVTLTDLHSALCRPRTDHRGAGPDGFRRAGHDHATAGGVILCRSGFAGHVIR